MPIYEYECQSCGEITEKWQKFSDSPLATCSECGGELNKLISQSAFHLKGSGWYVTDYCNKNTKKNLDSPKKNIKDSKKTSSTA